MKKVIALTCLLGALAFTAQAETKALIVTAENPEKSLTIEDGQVATVVFWGGVTLNSSKIKITVGDDTITFDKSSFSEIFYSASTGGSRAAATIQQPNFIPVVPGPATITLTKKDAAAAMITVKIENDSGTGDGNNVTVLPKSVDNVDLVLESSDDMVNWTEETLGEKPKANRKKFYRLRAKKE